MRSRLVPLLVPAAFFCVPVAAEPLDALPAARSCVVSEVSPVDAAPGGQALYRITFQNFCGSPRSFFWCAEHPERPVPAAVACASARGPGSVVRQVIQVRREYQWHLPAGAQIRYRDCPPQEIPTLDSGCEPAPPSAAQRR